MQSLTTALRYQADQACPTVRVIEVMMPLVETDMTAGRGSGKISAETAATALIEGLTRGRPVHRIGKTGVFVVLHRIAPGLAARVVRD